MKSAISFTLAAALCALIGCAPDNHAPEPTWALYPADGATGVFVDIALYWNASDEDGDPLTFDVYFGTSSSPPLIQDNTSDAWLDPGTLQYDAEYYWKVDVMDGHAKTEGDIWHFQTMPSTGNYQQYYLATGTYISMSGNNSDPDPERGAPWIALSSWGDAGGEAQWQFQGFSKAAVETLVVGAYSFDNGWDITGGEHYYLFNHETQDWDFLFDSDKSENWRFAQITGASAKPFVNDTTDAVILRLLTGYTDHSHIREVFCTQADVDTPFAAGSAPGTITIIGGMNTDR
jgi:hypothetical protein